MDEKCGINSTSSIEKTWNKFQPICGAHLIDPKISFGHRWGGGFRSHIWAHLFVSSFLSFFFILYVDQWNGSHTWIYFNSGHVGPLLDDPSWINGFQFLSSPFFFISWCIWMHQWAIDLYNFLSPCFGSPLMCHFYLFCMYQWWWTDGDCWKSWDYLALSLFFSFFLMLVAASVGPHVILFKNLRLQSPFPSFFFFKICIG